MMLSCKRSFRFWYALVKGKWDNCYEWNYTPGWNILLNALNIVKPPLLTNPLFPCKYPKPNRMLIFIWNTLAKFKEYTVKNLLASLILLNFVSKHICECGYYRPADHVVRLRHIKHLRHVRHYTVPFLQLSTSNKKNISILFWLLGCASVYDYSLMNHSKHLHC